MKQFYALVPDVETAKDVVDQLIDARIDGRDIHALVKRGEPLDDFEAWLDTIFGGGEDHRRPQVEAALEQGQVLLVVDTADESAATVEEIFIKELPSSAKRVYRLGDRPLH